MINADHMVTRTKHLHPRYTNADRIRNMTDEELAAYMDGSFRNADWCDQSKFPGGDCMEAPCIDCIIDLLKQEAEA